MLYAEALFNMKSSTVYLISRGYHTHETSSGTVYMSSSVMNGDVATNEEEIDLSKLPEPTLPPAEKPKKRRLRRKQDEVSFCILIQE